MELEEQFRSAWIDLVYSCQGLSIPLALVLVKKGLVLTVLAYLEDVVNLLEDPDVEDPAAQEDAQYPHPCRQGLWMVSTNHHHCPVVENYD